MIPSSCRKCGASYSGDRCLNHPTYLERLLADGVAPGTAEVMNKLYEDGHCPGCYLGDCGLPTHTCAMGQAALEIA